MLKNQADPDYLKGIIKIDSTPGEYTEVTVSLPVYIRIACYAYKTI
jgi:chemotaxis protein histidine kinase CheA